MEAWRGRLEKTLKQPSSNMFYCFKKPLTEGLIKSRPNRFIMFVEKGPSLSRCHCPSTGRIGDINFVNVPCLLSEAESDSRSTKCTVEAISLDPATEATKSWIGINQNMANRYLEHFILSGQLAEMLGSVRDLRREVKLRRSRIDFMVGNTYIEVKTPLIQMPHSENIRYREYGRMASFERLIKHFEALSGSIIGGKRAILLLCYLYDAEPFSPPPMDKHNEAIEKVASDAERKGVENWQVNLRIDPYGVSLVRCFKLQLFQ
jgi:sugar fermentation stimulation protein A